MRKTMTTIKTWMNNHVADPRWKQMRPSAYHPYWKKDTLTISDENLSSPESTSPESRPRQTERTRKGT